MTTFSTHHLSVWLDLAPLFLGWLWIPSGYRISKPLIQLGAGWSSVKESIKILTYAMRLAPLLRVDDDMGGTPITLIIFSFRPMAVTRNRHWNVPKLTTWEWGKVSVIADREGRKKSGCHQISNCATSKSRYCTTLHSLFTLSCCKVNYSNMFKKVKG